MGNIFEDIVQDIEVKPSKSKLVLKWVVRVAVLLITVAFILGQFKIRSINKVNSFEKSLQENTKAIQDLKNETEEGFNKVNLRIDKVYDDGYKAFDDFQQFNKKQLELIIDYGYTSKDLLKRMLDVNATEKTKSMETQLEQAKAFVPGKAVVTPTDSLTKPGVPNIVVKKVIESPIKK